MAQLEEPVIKTELEMEEDLLFPDGTEESEQGNGTSGDRSMLRNCEMCDIICGNDHAYELHMTGKGHLRALRLRENFEVLTDPESMKIVESEPSILESLKAVDEALVGLNYLIEFVPEDEGDSSVIWVCVLCGSTLTSDTLVKEHFIGKRHRYRYLSKYYPELSKQVHAKDKNSDKFNLCVSFAKEVEEREGKKFETIQVAVNPNQSKVKDEGPPAKKKPMSLLDMPLPAVRRGRGGSRGRPWGPPPPFMNGPFPPMIPAPRNMHDVLPILAQIPVRNMVERDFLIEASQILEQKLMDFNSFMGLDPYDGLNNATTAEYQEEGTYDDGTYDEAETEANESAVVEEDALTEETADENKGPVSLMDLPGPNNKRGWAGRGNTGYFF